MKKVVTALCAVVMFLMVPFMAAGCKNKDTWDFAKDRFSVSINAEYNQVDYTLADFNESNIVGFK